MMKRCESPRPHWPTALSRTVVMDGFNVENYNFGDFAPVCSERRNWLVLMVAPPGVVSSIVQYKGRGRTNNKKEAVRFLYPSYGRVTANAER